MIVLIFLRGIHIQLSTQFVHMYVCLSPLDIGEEKTRLDECHLEELVIIQNQTTFERMTRFLADKTRLGKIMFLANIERIRINI